MSGSKRPHLDPDDHLGGHSEGQNGARSRSPRLVAATVSWCYGWSARIRPGQEMPEGFMACKRSGVRIPIAPPMFCLETSFAAVSGLSSHPGWLGLVVAGRVEAEFADQFAVFLGDDPELKVAGEDEDLGAGPAASDADVVELAVVAQGELAVGVDGVAADAEVLADADAAAGGDGPGPGGPGSCGGAAAGGPVGPGGVVVRGEGV